MSKKCVTEAYLERWCNQGDPSLMTNDYTPGKHIYNLEAM